MLLFSASHNPSLLRCSSTTCRPSPLLSNTNSIKTRTNSVRRVPSSPRTSQLPGFARLVVILLHSLSLFTVATLPSSRHLHSAPRLRPTPRSALPLARHPVRLMVPPRPVCNLLSPWHSSATLPSSRFAQALCSLLSSTGVCLQLSNTLSPYFSLPIWVSLGTTLRTALPYAR